MGTLYLIRHGQASFNAADYDQLSALGEVQAAQLGAWFRARNIMLHASFCGAMKRHKQTADHFENAYGPMPAAQVHAGLNEYDHEAILKALIAQYDDPDEFEQHMQSSADPRKAFQAIFEKAIARWVSGQHNTDYPESWQGFKARVMSGLGHVVAQATQLQTGGESANVAVFTSGGALTCIAQALMNIPDEHAFKLNWVITNCSVSKVLFSQRGMTMASFNEQAHFEGQVQGLLPDQPEGLTKYAKKPNGLISYR